MQCSGKIELYDHSVVFCVRQLKSSHRKKFRGYYWEADTGADRDGHRTPLRPHLLSLRRLAPPAAPRLELPEAREAGS